METRILVVEDDESIAELIVIALRQAGYQCEYVDDGEVAANAIEEKEYDLVLLDIMLPQIDGYELMEYIEPLKIPVIFITAKGRVKDKVKGLRMGADDYLVKPFEIEELLARVEVVLRRYGKGLRHIYINGLDIDLSSRTVKRNGTTIGLTRKEFDLLVIMVRNKNILVPREVLFERIWEKEFTGETRTLDLHIQRLRKKVNWKNELRSIYGMGYILEERK